MQKPIQLSIKCRNRWCLILNSKGEPVQSAGRSDRVWPISQEYMAEYLIYKYGVLRMSVLWRLLTTEFGAYPRQSNASAILARLVLTKRVDRIARGVYRHRDSPMA